VTSQSVNADATFKPYGWIGHIAKYFYNQPGGYDNLDKFLTFTRGKVNIYQCKTKVNDSTSIAFYPDLNDNFKIK
jgi:hypothetical protein